MVVKPRQSVYMSGPEAWSYVIVSVLSVISPTILLINNDTMPSYISLFLTIFINAVVQIREYVLLIPCDRVTKSFWWKRLAGCAASILAAVYSMVILLIINTNHPEKIYFYMKLPNVVLLFVPIVIASIEGIDYIGKNKERTILQENTYNKKDSDNKVTNKVSRGV